MIDNLYSFRGGGGGSLIDVRVNGESVVTDKIASITSYMEITQAEYDELPSSKTSDGVAYFISDTSKLILNGTQYDLPASGGFAEPSDSYGSNGDIYIKYKQSSIVPYLDNYEIGYDGDGYFDTGLVVTNLPTCTLDVKQYGMVSETEELLFEYNESVDLKNISHYLSIYDDDDNPVCTISLASSQNPITMQIEKHNTPSLDFRLEVSVYQSDSVPHEIENIYYKVDGQWICINSLKAKAMSYYDYNQLTPEQKKDGSIYFVSPEYTGLGDDIDLEPNKTFSFQDSDLVSVVENFHFDIPQLGFTHILNDDDAPFFRGKHFIDFQGNDRTYNELAGAYGGWGEQESYKFATESFGGSDTSTHYKIPSKWTYDGNEYYLKNYNYFYAFGEWGNYADVIIYVTNNPVVTQCPYPTWINIPTINDGFIFAYNSLVARRPEFIRRCYKEGNLWNITGSFYYNILATNGDYMAVGMHLVPDGSGWNAVNDSTSTKHANYMLDSYKMLNNDVLNNNIYYMDKLYTDVPTIIANPPSDYVSTLNKLQIGNIVYGIEGGSGTEVEANPSGTATDELNSVRIGNTVYDIPSGTGANNAVTQTANSDDEDYRVLLSHSPDDVTETSGVYKHGYLTYNPDLQALSVPTVKSNLLESSNVSISDDVYLKDGGYWVDQNFTSIGDIAQAVHDTPIVTANPSGTATGSLTSLGINNVIYEISGGGGGTTVIANPSGEATADLTKIQIGNTIYDIEGGGGSSENKIPYLKSSGAQYIDTGIVAKGNISICTEFFIDLDQYDPSESWATVYCGQDGNEFNSIAYAYNQSTGGNSLQYGNNHNEPEYQIVPEVIHKAGVVKGKTFIDNNIHSYGVTSFSSNYNIALFAANAGGSIVGNSKYCLVSCKIWDGDTLVRDFIPTTDNNVPCLLDRVNNTYYYNQGSGADFTYGERTISLVSKSGGGSWTDVTGTLTAGQTTLTLTNSAITTDSTLDFYTDTFGINPTDVTVMTGSVTLTFEAQANDIEVKVRVTSDSSSGGKTINYSTTEQDTGLKWVDGKSIYQKTFLFNNLTTGENVLELGNSSDFDVIIDYEFTCIRNNDRYVNIGLTNVWGEATISVFNFRNVDNKLKVSVTSGYYTASDFYLTIRYTKSTTQNNNE